MPSPQTHIAVALVVLAVTLGLSGCASSPDRRAAVSNMHLSQAERFERRAREYDEVGNAGMRDYYLHRSHTSRHNGIAASCDPVDHIVFDVFLKTGVCTSRRR